MRWGRSAPGLSAPNTELDGHPAYVTGGYACVYRVNGFDVQISASGSVLTKLNRTGGVPGLFHRMTVLGTDPATWTTSPVS